MKTQPGRARLFTASTLSQENEIMMLPAFGFSVGDFIAVLGLVSTVVDALRESGDSTTQCRQVLRQLVDLETALILVRRLELDERQKYQQTALQRAATQCRTTIDEFMAKIAKYQPHLHGTAASPSQTVKQSWYKIKWALYRKEDLEKFKADVTGHTEAISILMDAIQIEKLALEAKDQAQRHNDLKNIVYDCFSKTMQKLSIISSGVTSTVSSSKEILNMTMQTMQMDCRIFGAVLDIQSMLRNVLAPQVLRSQPVYFVDVLGKPAPFHLEFIRSTDAFMAVLRANLQGHESALARFDKGDFVISDTATKRDVNLGRPWQVCFRPGQHVDMSMIVSELDAASSTTVCPSCKTECTGNTGEDTDCPQCGLTFRRISEVKTTTLNDSQSRADEQENGSKKRGPAGPSLENIPLDELADELLLYRKV